jgi:hypothetical protein
MLNEPLALIVRQVYHTCAVFVALSKKEADKTLQLKTRQQQLFAREGAFILGYGRSSS